MAQHILVRESQYHFNNFRIGLLCWHPLVAILTIFLLWYVSNWLHRQQIIMPDGSLITSISTPTHSHLKVMQDTAWIRAASYGKVNRVTRTLWNQDDSCAPGWAHITITPTRFLSQNTKQLRHVKGNDFHFSAILQLLDSVVAGVTYPLKHLTNNYCPFSFFSYIFDRSLSFCISPITKQQIDDTIPKRGT